MSSKAQLNSSNFLSRLNFCMSYYHLNAEEEVAISYVLVNTFIKERITLEFKRILISIHRICFKQQGSVCGKMGKAGRHNFRDWN